MSGDLNDRQLAAKVMAALTADADLHLDDEQLADYADGRATDAAGIERHLAVCDDCAANVADLRELRRAIAARGRRSILPLAAAAAAMAAAGAAWWMWPRAHAPAVVPQPAVVAAVTHVDDGGAPVLVGANDVIAGLERLTPDERAAIARAVGSGRLPAPRNLDRVRSGAGRLMGDSSTPLDSFGPASPVATAVDDDRPRLRWSPLAGARGYVITVVDDQLRPVAESPMIAGTDWRPASPLGRGRVYVWQVRALLKPGERIAPAPPQPEARFYVLDDHDAAEVASLRERADGSRLAGILLAQYGLLDDAEGRLVNAAADNPSVTSLPRLAEAARSARRAAPTDHR